MTVKAILQGKGNEVVSISVGTPVSEAVALLAEKRIGAVPIIDGESVVGVLSERDIIHSLASDGAAALESTVEKIMTAPAITVTPDVPVLSALSQMSRRRIRHLPVVVDGRLTGIVSIGDLVAFRIRRIEDEAEAMRIYIQSA